MALGVDGEGGEKPADKTEEAVRLSQIRMGQAASSAPAPSANKPKSKEEQNPFH